MIRLSLLQFRSQAITAAVAVAAFTVLLAATGPHLASMYAADGLDGCHGSSCQNLAIYFTASLARSPYGVLFLLSTGIILLAPAVLGLFSLMQAWWAVPISQAVADGSGAGVGQSRFSQLNFATHGITPLGYAAFAFALGVTAGALTGYCFRRLSRLS
jgi:hypothetical protein